MIGIVTINDMGNYGNRLQNYALSELLKKYDFVTTIRLYTAAESKPQYIKAKFRRFNQYVTSKLKSWGKGAKAAKAKRILKGVAFTNTYVPDDKYILTAYRGLEGDNTNSLKTIVLGSDQVWNDRWISQEDLSLRLGSFTTGESLLSYAASFGVNDVKLENKTIFSKLLPRLSSISVREDQGVKIIKDLVDLPSTVVLDPTLMIDKSNWLDITEGFVDPDEKYIVTYFLGEPSERQEQDIQNYAAAHGCRVRRILDLRDLETYSAGPQDFVELIANAQYVFTDSYHACCFSILFHKQFTVYNRVDAKGESNMNSRMHTLFRLFNLDTAVRVSGLSPEIDYASIDSDLEHWRNQSRQWLNQAMSK